MVGMPSMNQTFVMHIIKWI